MTSWAWFGAHMPDVGLHSYGFTGAAFYSLAGFVAAEVLVIAGALARPSGSLGPRGLPLRD